jgi:hypothetical protein
MIIRKMQVVSKIETLNQTLFELRRDNGHAHADDRATVVVKAGEAAPPWQIGQVVEVSLNTLIVEQARDALVMASLEED